MIALLLTVALHPVIIDDYVDVIEVNHFYDENGRLVFDQVIYWDLFNDGEYHVFDWRLLKRQSQWPQRDYQRGGYVSVWYDGDTLRRVRSSAAVETWTQFDPEVTDRENIPVEKRPRFKSRKLKRRSRR